MFVSQISLMVSKACVNYFICRCISSQNRCYWTQTFGGLVFYGRGGVKKILFLSSSLFGYLFTTCFFLNLIRIQNTRLGRQVFYQIHVYRLPYIMTMIDHLEMDFSSNDLEFLMKQSLKHII